MIRRSLIHDPEVWDQMLLQLPAPHILQTWLWGTFKAGYGWRPFRWVWKDERGRVRAAAQALYRRDRLGLLGIFYLPRGPLLDPSDTEAAEAVLCDLEEEARRHRAVLVRIDPEVVEAEGPAAEGPCDPVEVPLKTVLQRRGWRSSAESVQFPASLWLDLTASEEELLQAMHPKTRYNIRLAKRKGVRVRPVGPEAFDLLYDLYVETAARDRFVIRPRAYYRQAWTMFYEAGYARPLLAEVEGEPVAMVMIYRFGPTAWYFYGASRDRHREKMPNYRLQWEAIRWARSVGCRRYDLWGAPAVPAESDPLWGVYRFKRGFGGRYVRFIGTWDYTPWPALYRLYIGLIPRYLAWLRRRHWRRVGVEPGPHAGLRNPLD